jgi:hypothetical protein
VACKKVHVGPRSTAPVSDRRWMRFKSAGTRTRFRGLSAGRYDVIVFDGVFGVVADLDPDPLIRTVEIRESDVELEIDVTGTR